MEKELLDTTLVASTLGSSRMAKEMGSVNIHGQARLQKTAASWAAKQFPTLDDSETGLDMARVNSNGEMETYTLENSPII